MFELETLSLSTGRLAVSLLVFGSPLLQAVDLYEVTGLLNEDLTIFLSQAASTLTSLKIQKCQIFRPRDQEYAVDSEIGNMKNLSNLTLDGDLLSSLTLLRKIPQDQSDDQPMRQAAVSITSPDPVIEEGFVDAVKVTAWTRIIIIYEGWSWNPKSRKKAAKVAAQRGISLELAYQRSVKAWW
jgi:hypothetical protein